MNGLPRMRDRAAHMALALCILPLISVAIGIRRTRAAEVVEAQKLFDRTLAITGALSLLPMAAAVAAFVVGGRNKGRICMAVLAILIPIALLLIFYVGCFRLAWLACNPGG